MASIEQERWLRFAWNAARYALGPIGGLLVPWLVIQRSSQEAWGQVVLPMILVQLVAHITQWGSKDLLLREFARMPDRVLDLWRASAITRAVPWIVCALMLTRSGLILKDAWAMSWLVGLVLANNVEPLIIWGKKFAGAAVADAMGLGVQVAIILWNQYLDADTICLSFAGNQIARALILWSVVGFPSLGHAFRLFNMRMHLLTALPFFLIGFSGLLASRIDLYTANVLLDRAEVGRYQIVASLFIQFQALAALVVTPLTKDLYRLNIESVSRYARRMRMWALAGLLPMCAIAWAVLTFLFKFELSWGVYAAAGALVWPVFAYVPMMNQLYKHHRELSVMWANFAAAALTCGLTLVLLPKLGIAGGLLAAAAGQWLMLAWMKREEHRLHALPRM
ncbi:MAG: hypothetical protein IPG74_00100 [Flavobacteriales bacterium]|nr:hypothetical protein [Flavobacteriales bacterium]